MSFAATFRREPSAVLDLIEVLVEVGGCALDGALPLALEGVTLAAVFDERDSTAAARPRVRIRASRPAARTSA